MSSKDFFEVALKILGIYFLVVGVQTAITTLGYIIVLVIPSNTPMDSEFRIIASQMVTLIFSTALYVFAAWLIFKKSEIFVQKIFPNENSLNIEKDENWDKKFFVIGLKILGLFLAIYGLVDIVEFLCKNLLSYHNDSAFILISHILKFLTGLYLLIGYKNVNKKVNKIFARIIAHFKDEDNPLTEEKED